MFLKIFPSHIFLYTYLIGSFSNRDHVSVMWEPQYNLEEKVNPASFTEKRWNKAKHLNWNSIRLEFVKKTACQILSKALDISRATVQVALDLLKALAILLDITTRKSAVGGEALKPYWKSKHNGHISLHVINKPIIFKFFRLY